MDGVVLGDPQTQQPPTMAGTRVMGSHPTTLTCLDVQVGKAENHRLASERSQAAKIHAAEHRTLLDKLESKTELLLNGHGPFGSNAVARILDPSNDNGS
jgi:hypothetical protein